MAENIKRRISIFINGKDVEDSLKGVGKAIGDYKKQLRAAKTEEDRAAANKQLQEARKRYAEINDELRDTKVTLSDMRGAFENSFNALLSGDIKGAKEGLSGIKNGIVGATKASLAFIATPIGATLAVLAAGFAAGKAIFDYNAGLHEMNEELRALGVSGADMSAVRSEVKATADTFKKEFKVIANTATGMAEAYGISISEANAVISQGLADGGAKNDEFLESLGEYKGFFDGMGYSAQETADIINQGYELGIYTDKLPDALKEADLALKEQTKTSRDALVNAFGASFSDDLLKRVSSGEITTKNALERIAKKSEEVELNKQQQAQLTADIFKGAGEDAGGALKVLEAVGKAATRELDATAKAQLKLANSNERLNKAQAALFEVEGLGDVWTQIQAVAVDSLASMLEYLADIKKDIQPLIDLVSVGLVNAFNGLKTTLSVVFGFIKTVLGAFSKLVSGDVKGAFIDLSKGVYNVFVNIYNTVVDVIKNLASAMSLFGVDVDGVLAKLDSFKGKEFEIKGKVTTENETTNTETNQTKNPTTTTTETKSQEELDREAKEAEERKKRREKEIAEAKAAAIALAKAKTELAKIQLDKYIADNQTKLEDDKKLSEASLAEEQKRLQGILDEKLLFMEQEKQRKLAENEESALSDEEKFAKKRSIQTAHELEKQKLEVEFHKSTDALKKQYDEEQKIIDQEAEALRKEQKLLDEELAIAEADSAREVQLLKEQAAYDNQLAGYRDLVDKKVITEEEYNRFKEAADKKREELDRSRQLQQLQGTLGGMNQLAGALGEMFGQSKELAIVQAGINGAMAVTSILAQYPKFDGGFAMAAAIAAAGISTVAQISKITSAKKPKKPKFYKGGHTGSAPALGTDEYGPVTGYVHKNEWVAPEWMTQDPVYADTIGWLENRRQNKLSGFVEGGETTPGAVPEVTDEANSTENSNTAMAMFVQAINKLNALLGKGIQAHVVIGYDQAKAIEDLNTESNTSDKNGVIAE